MADPLIDTAILVSFLRNFAPAVDYLSGFDSHARPATHGVVVAELIEGCRSRTDLRAVDRLLRQFDVVTPDAADVLASHDLLRRHFLPNGVGWADCLIAATCLRLHRPLVTPNLKHFRSIRGLNLLHPYRTTR